MRAFFLIRTSEFRLEEGVSEWFGSEEGFGEVVVVLRCPEESLSIVTLSILCALHCGVSWIGQKVQLSPAIKYERMHWRW